MIDLAVCTPSPALRTGLAALLSADPELRVVAATASLDELALLGVGPRVIIATADGLSESRPGSTPLPSSLSADIQPDTALLLLTDIDEEAQELAGAGLSVWGVVTNQVSAEMLQSAVHAMAEGLVVASPEFLSSTLNRPRSPSRTVPITTLAINPEEDDLDPVEPLTERESEVLQLISRGLTNKQIALALHISEHTVKFHVSSIFNKLDVSNRTEALRKGARRGLIPL